MTPLVSRARRWPTTRHQDGEVQRELGARALPLPTGLDLSWLGTAGYRLDYEGHTLLIAPYLSRAPLADLLRRRALDIDPGAADRHLADIGDVVGILVGHTHFDHALDVPDLARRFGAPALGSTSLTHLMGLHGLADQAVTVEPRRRYELGPFAVRFVPSAHAKLAFGLAVPSAGELTCDHLDRLTAGAYRCGQVWGIQIEVAGTSIYHLGSAELLEDEVDTGRVDLVLAGIAGRSTTRRYLPRLLSALRPAVLVPTHYDDFFQPLDDPMSFSRGVNLAAFVDDVERTAPGLDLVALTRA